MKSRQHRAVNSFTRNYGSVTKRGRDVAIYKSQVIKLLNIKAALSASRLQPPRSRGERSFTGDKGVVIATAEIEVATYSM